MEYVDHPSFHEPGAEAILDAPFPKPKQGGLGEDESRCFLAYNLARKFGRKELAAKWENLICKANLGLCGNVAAMRTDVHLDKDDRNAECSIALIKAMRAFDVQRGVRFSTLATEAMMRRMSHLAKYQGRQRRIPGCRLVLIRFPITAPKPVEGIDEAAVRDIRDAIEALEPRLRMVAKARLIDGATLAEVGAMIGRTKERARQLEQDAKALIRQAIQRN